MKEQLGFHFQFNGMFRIPKREYAKLNKEFKNKAVSEIEIEIKKRITEDTPLPSEFCPKRRCPFIYYYKINKIEIIMIYLHDWRILGTINKKKIIEELVPAEYKYLKNVLKKEAKKEK